MKRSWLEEEKRHRFLAESKLRTFLKASFHEFRSEFGEDVPAAKLANAVLDYLACSQQSVRVARGTKRYKATSLEVLQQPGLEAEDINELDSVVALIVHPNFKLIGQWVDRVRSTVSDFGLNWSETRPVLERLLRTHREPAHSGTVSGATSPGVKPPRARGRPRQDERAGLILKLRSEGKSWKQIQLECNRSLVLDLSKDAYRNLARSRQRSGQKSN